MTTGYFYFQDSLGNTSHVTDAVGNLLESYTYTAFGTPTFYNTSPDHTQSLYHIKHLFQGQLWTQETGLNDYRNRVEFPTMGVFLQPDPLGFKGDAANIYRFCGNDPIDRTDPLGLIDNNGGGSCSTLTSFGGGDWIKGSDGLSASDWNHKHDQPAGNIQMGLVDVNGGSKNDNGKFYGAIDKFTHSSRRDGAGISSEDIGSALVADAREAARQEADNLHPGHGVNTGQERTYAEYVNGRSLVRSGPKIGENYSQGPQSHLPGSPNGLARNAFPLTVSHSHGPGSGRSLDRLDERSADGLFGRQYISSVGSTKDNGSRISIYVPGGGGYFHSTDGNAFFNGR